MSILATVQTRQILIMVVGGLTLFVTAWRLSRHQVLSIRYALGWMALGVLVASSSVLAPLVPDIGSVLGMTPTGLLLVAVTTVLVVVCIQLSVAVSVLQQRIVKMAQEIALSKEPDTVTTHDDPEH